MADRPFWWAQNPEERPFEYGPFMRETRLEADRLLAERKIDEAEAYMEARRQILVEQGHNIRKLNQAYFAFHGSYAVGAAATDPIGAKLRALRMRSATLADFVQTVAAITSADALDAALTKRRPHTNHRAELAHRRADVIRASVSCHHPPSSNADPVRGIHSSSGSSNSEAR